MDRIGDITAVAFDTETTGLHFSSRLVELAGVKFRGREVLGTFETLVDPGEPIPPEATRVHGIRDSDVTGKPGAAGALQQFEAFVGDALLIAHNAPYDTGILATEYARLRRRPPDWRVLDSCTLAKSAHLRTPDYKLPTLAAYFGLPGGAHRALADSHCVHQVFLRCLEAAHLGLGAPIEAVIGWAGGLGSLTDYVEIVESLPDRFRALVEALEAGQPVTISYAGGSKGTAPRVVSPRAFYKRYGLTYMEAECDKDRIVKSFRLDRILKIQFGRGGNS